MNKYFHMIFELVSLIVLFMATIWLLSNLLYTINL